MEARTVTLYNGIEMPKIGLGTFQAKPGYVEVAVNEAIKCQIKAIDTASIYKNEKEIADMLRQRKVDRSSVFLTSKLSPYEQGTQAAEEACNGIFRRLDWVDLLLIHWPGASGVDIRSPDNQRLRHETWRVLEKVYKAGRVRAIGVSNFTVNHLEKLLEIAEVRPAVNQVEIHPCYQQTDLLHFCKREGIIVTAYASLGQGRLLSNTTVLDVAQKTNKTASQVLLRWGLQRGCCVIPKSIVASRIKEFAENQLLDWKLSEPDVALLDALPQPKKFCWDPSVIV